MMRTSAYPDPEHNQTRGNTWFIFSKHAKLYALYKPALLGERTHNKKFKLILRNRNRFCYQNYLYNLFLVHVSFQCAFSFHFIESRSNKVLPNLYTGARHDLFVFFNIDHPYTVIYTVYYSTGVVNIIEDK